MGTVRGMTMKRNLLGHMERLTELSRIQRSLQRPPDQRTEPDCERLEEETGHVEALRLHGPGVHHDLCYVLEALAIQRGETKRVASLPGGGDALFIVLSGSITVTTAKPELYEAVLDSNFTTPREDAKTISEESMKDLFQSLDEDGSGTVDALELMHALEMLGMDVTWGEMEEAIAAVDVDGSGELDFDEFKTVMEDRLGLNKKRAVRGWQSAGAMEGMFCREYGDGEVFGELALLEGHTLEGTVTSDDTEPVVALLSKANYDHVVANGFKGDLKRKLEYLKAPALVQRLLHHTDLKVLSYACSLETYSAKSVLYRQGAAAQDVFFLVEGEVKLLTNATLNVEPALLQSKHGARRQRGTGLRSKIEVACVQAFDILCGTELRQDATHAYTAEAVGTVIVMSLPLKKMAEIAPPGDMGALRRHAQLREEWRTSRTLSCSDTRGGALERQLEASLAQRAQADIAHAEATATWRPQAAAWGRAAEVSDGLERVTGITRAAAQSQRLTGSQRQLRWIPKDSTLPTEERNAREVALVVSMQAQRGAMLASLQQLAPGRTIASPSLVRGEPGGWEDVRGNVAVYREAEEIANELRPRTVDSLWPENPWERPISLKDPGWSPRFNKPMTPHGTRPDLRSAVPRDVAQLRASMSTPPGTAGSTVGKRFGSLSGLPHTASMPRQFPPSPRRNLTQSAVVEGGSRKLLGDSWSPTGMSTRRSTAGAAAFRHSTTRVAAFTLRPTDSRTVSRVGTAAPLSSSSSSSLAGPTSSNPATAMGGSYSPPSHVKHSRRLTAATRMLVSDMLSSNPDVYAR